MLEVRVDVEGITQTLNHLFLLSEKNIRYMTARAMTRSAQAAQETLKQQMPRYIRGGPVPFTRNSTYVRFANPGNLTAEVGFKDWASKGTPAGRYLSYMATGTPRAAKSTERQLRSAGILRGNEFITPANVTPLRLNAFGNLTGGQYTQVLSRLKALGQQGYTGNVSSSGRSQSKRSNRDYFVGSPGGQRGIYVRVGTRPKGKGGKGSPNGGRPATAFLPRGFHTAFYITRQPRYRATFPITAILNTAFERSWAVELRAAYAAELAGRTGIRV